MRFDIYTSSGFHHIAWFDTIEQLLESMKKYPYDTYHRITK